MPWKHNGKTIKEGKAWVADDGTQHPAVWMRWSDSEKKENGLTWEDPPASEDSFDETFYSGRQTNGTLIEKSLTDVQLMNKTWSDSANDWVDDGVLLDVNGNAVVDKGLKTIWIERTKSVANTMLAKYDWQVVRKSEKGTAIDSDVATYRDAIRTKCDSIVTAINNCSNLTEFKALFNVPKDSDGNITGNAPIYDFPNEI
tara:strand:- start:897 stop:1496 length:600 start_codon:yes stop_codon:yes gene_type:complete